MFKLKSIDLTCPNCEHLFVSEAVRSSDARGRKSTDFRLETDGPQPVAYGVHLCSRCGFAGPEDWFTAANGVSYEVRQRVWDELTPRLAQHDVSSSEKYEFAAKVAAWDGIDPRQIADLWLRAAWCCVEEGDIEAERFYRRHAAWSFEEALDSYEGVDADERATLTYLVGELWRRVGDDARAGEWFGRVAEEVIDPAKQAWVLRWAKQQIHDPREWFV